MPKVVPFFELFVFFENFAAMFSKEITEIISTTDSCIGFLRERGVLRAIPPFCPECNERTAEEKDSGRGDKRAWRAELLSGYLDEYLWRGDTEKMDQLPLRTYYPTSLRSTLKIAKISQIYNFFPIL